MEEMSANQLDSNDTTSEPDSNDQDLNDELDANDMQAINIKTNGLNKLTTNKSVPLILKRNRSGSDDKLDCSESNENIDDNKKRKIVELKSIDEKNDQTKELVQRSSSRKKTKKSFGSDFLDLDRAQFTSKQIAKKHRPKNCAYCLKNDGEIHHCKFCRLRGHQNCFQLNSGVSRDGYKNKVVICSHCRHCEMCDEKDGQLFFCSRCNSVFHRLCDSNLSLLLKPIFGQWQCSFCDTLDSLVGDSLTEEQRKKEIQRRKLLVMRKRLRKSDYVLEDGLCSIQQVVNQAVQNRRNDMDQTDRDSRNEIDLSDDELDAFKHILNETKETDFWLDDLSIDFNRLEEFLKRQRKNHNILSKQIEEDKKYFTLVKVFIDQLKEDEFRCTKDQFIKELSSESFKRSFFEHNSLNGLSKSSIFIDALIKCFEKSLQIEYWKPTNVNVNDPISQQDYFTSQTKQDKEGKNENSIVKDNLEYDEELENDYEEETKKNDNEVNQIKIEISSMMDEQKLKITDFSGEFNLILPINNKSKLKNEFAISKSIIDPKEEIIDPTLIVNESSPEEQKIAVNLPSMETDLVDELICKGPNHLNSNDDKTKNLTKIGETPVFNQVSTLMSIDPTDLDEDQSVSVQDDLVKTNLSDDILVENIPEKRPNESNNSREIIISIDDLTKNKIDQLQNQSSDESTNEQKCKDSVETNDKDKNPEANENNSNEDNSNESNSNESNSNEDNLNNEQLTGQSTDRVKSTSEQNKSEVESNRSDEIETNGTDKVESNKSDKVKSVETKLIKPLENRPANEMNQIVKTNKKITKKKKMKSNKRKFKIKSSTNLVDKLFKRACKYNLSLLEPKYWTAEDVTIYLKQIGFENEAQKFKEKSIDGKSLLKLSRQEVLTNFGIKLGKAVKIYAYLNDLQVKHKCNISFD